MTDDDLDVIVTFPAATAEDCVGRFVEWAGTDAGVSDLGVVDGVRRYRVGRAAWRDYSRAVTRRPAPTVAVMRFYRCDGCGVVSVPGALARHQSASGHEGRTEVAR